MSYDLFFFAPPGVSVGDADVLAYFSGRPHYKVDGSQVWYQNEDTGVYFSFDVGAEPFEGAEEGAEHAPSIVRFNLNYFRPHVFGLEAEREVSALIDAFSLAIDDPQNGGMGEGPYSREGFLRGWNQGNQFGYRSILSQHGPQAAEFTMPAAEIERYWRWNLERAALQQRLGETVFVPKVWFFSMDGRLRSAVAWPDAIGVALPEVDMYVIGRKEFAPRRFFMKKQDMCLVAGAQVQAVVGKYPLRDGALPCRLLQYEKQPAELVSWLGSLSPYAGGFAFVKLDKILNAELVAQCSQG